MKVVKGYKCLTCGAVYPVTASKAQHQRWAADGATPYCSGPCYDQRKES